MGRTFTYQETITLQELSCAHCGIMFAAPQKWLEQVEQEKRNLYCPNGHALIYGEGEMTRLQKRLATEQERSRSLELQLTSTLDQLQATKRELTSHKKRTANGVCPCCHRSFVQLQRHMQTKHPEYKT